MPRPKNKKELKSMLGFIQYYGRFLKNASTLLYPLNKLLQNNVHFKWDKNCEKSFQSVKREMQSDNFLVHFNPKLPLILATDASPYGVSAILSHICEDGLERPISFASQTLSKVQQRYSQIDKEAYGIVFGVRKYYQYLYGRKFTLVTDCRPLSQIFSANKSLPLLTASRMQHYALFLEAFQYDIKYKNTNLHANADALSRLPMNDDDVSETDISDFVQVNQISNLPVTVEVLAQETRKDHELLPLLKGLKFGQEIDKSLRFNIDQLEFSLQQGCILRGLRVVVPKKLRNKILDELHIGHFGIVKMKSLARSYCWWPGIDQDIEKLSKNCIQCNKCKNNPKPVSHFWQSPKAVFDRVHLDFAGPFMGTYFFILVDSYSKWPEIHMMNRITASDTIIICKRIFASYGVPRVIVSDNGSQFTCHEFENFLRSNGIKHRFSAPYNPATNGQVERYVQTLKNSLKKINCSRKDLENELQNFLLQYRKIPHCITGVSPAMLFLKREIRTKIDLLQPDFNVTRNKHPKASSFRNLEVGTRVIARDYLHDCKWCFGKVIEKLGNLHYIVLLDNGNTWRRHINQLREVGENTYIDTSNVQNYFYEQRENAELLNHPDNIKKEPVSSEIADSENVTSTSEYEDDSAFTPPVPASSSDVSESTVSVPILRRSQRTIRPPVKLDL